MGELSKRPTANTSRHVPYTQGCITGEEMLKVVQGMGKTVPGPDGWRIHELKLLGLTAWKQRARIVAVQMMEGKVPASYTQVSTPMMAKSRGTEVIMDHRGLSIFTILWRIESSAWYKRLQILAGKLVAGRHPWS